jgi:hypothetical protein
MTVCPLLGVKRTCGQAAQEKRRGAANIAKLPELVRRTGSVLRRRRAIPRGMAMAKPLIFLIAVSVMAWAAGMAIHGF